MEAERVLPAADYWPEAEAEEETWQPSRHSAAAHSTVAIMPMALETPAVEQRSAEGSYRDRWKRVVDLALGIPLFVAAMPVILVLALLIGATSGWPVLHTARRIGRDGREFRMWKLRTMVKDADKVLDQWWETDPEMAREYFADFKLKNDPRITLVGKVLRKSSLDELPQFWNVLRGDMSLVGPRPIVKDELSHYGESAADFLAVRPGITGLWQTEGRNEVRYPERSWYELTYCRTHDFALDLKILLKTLRCPIRFDG